jgi:6-phosphogluconolactonase
VIAGNYSSGTIAVFPIAPDGGIGASVVSLQHQGAGTDAKRQSGPHVHATVLTHDHDYLLVPDLGIDRVMVYSFNTKNGLLKHQKSSLKLADGSGPRHLDFHPSGKWAYVVQELSGTITGLRYHKGKLEEQQVITMLPPDY